MSDLSEYQRAVIRMSIVNISKGMESVSHRFLSLNPAIWSTAIAEEMKFDCTADDVMVIWDEVRTSLIRDTEQRT